MSQENVELLDRALAAWNEGGVDATIDLYAEDAEFDISTVALDYGPSPVGRNAVAQFYRYIEQLWSHPSITPVEDIEPVGPHHVVVEVSVRGVSEVSEVEVEQRFVFAFGVRDGEIAWGGLFRTRAEALEAVGLRE